MSDLISRDAAIVALANNRCGNDEWDLAVTHDVETIKKLPSVEPEIEKCDDCISRTELLKKLKKVSTESWKMKLNCRAELVWNQCIDFVEDAKSVEPERKKGKWIKHEWAEESNGCLIPNYECNQCHTWKLEDSDYCPDCGSYNGGTDNVNE